MKINLLKIITDKLKINYYLRSNFIQLNLLIKFKFFKGDNFE